MADLFLTTEQLEDLFWKVTMRILGYDPEVYNDPDHPPASMPVRISWPTDGAPAWKIDEDIAFIRVGEEADDINLTRDTILSERDEDSADQLTGQTRVIRVHWLLYGPNSLNNASQIRNGLFVDQYRSQLTKNNMYLVPRIKTPQRLPELYGGRWWERADIAASFNELIRYDSVVPYLKSADITVSKSPESGVTIQTDASVNQNTKTHGGV